jgi:hypothetical protein
VDGLLYELADLDRPGRSRRLAITPSSEPPATASRLRATVMSVAAWGGAEGAVVVQVFRCESFQFSPSVSQHFRYQQCAIVGQHVEDERDGGMLCGQLLGPRGRLSQPRQQLVEGQLAVDRDDHLAL